MDAKRKEKKRKCLGMERRRTGERRAVSVTISPSLNTMASEKKKNYTLGMEWNGERKGLLLLFYVEESRDSLHVSSIRSSEFAVKWNCRLL